MSRTFHDMGAALARVLRDDPDPDGWTEVKLVVAQHMAAEAEQQLNRDLRRIFCGVDLALPGNAVLFCAEPPPFGSSADPRKYGIIRLLGLN